MSALAIAFHKKGYIVTGSDKGFYPPVSTYLKEAGIEFYPGWHVEKMLAPRSGSEGGGDPDLVIVGNVASTNNPEFIHKKEILSTNLIQKLLLNFLSKKILLFVPVLLAKLLQLLYSLGFCKKIILTQAICLVVLV